MWTGVTARFRQFNANLTLTDDQKADGATKHRGVRRRLNSHYYNSSSDAANSFLIGSWDKKTRVRPPRDVDLYFVLPYEVYLRFEQYTGNRQSALLQEVKGVLQSTYPATDMSGDGQVVVVRFNTISVEVVPAFELQNGRYWICDTHDGGSYKETDPAAERGSISTLHAANNNNLRPIIKMLKAWQANCNVPLKSFYIELLVSEFLPQSSWRLESYFYYDWLMRDFFKYLQTRENGYLFAPGTYELLPLGDAWKTKCDRAYGHALEACVDEYNDWTILAGEEWQKIFGDQIPKFV